MLKLIAWKGNRRACWFFPSLSFTRTDAWTSHSGNHCGLNRLLENDVTTWPAVFWIIRLDCLRGWVSRGLLGQNSFGVGPFHFFAQMVNKVRDVVRG